MKVYTVYMVCKKTCWTDKFILGDLVTTYYVCKQDLITGDMGEGLMLRDGTLIYYNSAFRAKNKKELLRKLNARKATRILGLDIVRYYGTEAGARRKIAELAEC